MHEFEAGRGKVEIKGGVPVRRFPSPSRSIHFGDISEVNGEGTFGPRDLKRFGRTGIMRPSN